MRSSLDRTKEVVSKVKHIQEESIKKGEKGTKYLTDRCNNIAKDENERLNVIVDKKTGELTSQPNCSHRYYCTLMDKYKDGIKALGFKHHSIERNVKSFINKYKKEKPEVEKLLDINLPIQKIRENLIILRAGSISNSSFRRDLINLKVEHHAFYMFDTKGAIKDWISQDSKVNLKAKLQAQVTVNKDWVIKITNDLLTKKTPDVTDLAIGIALATGRRLTEVMKTAQFTKIDSESLLFSGQLKTKNRHLFEELKPYEIPCLIDAGTVVKALSNLRKATKNDTLSYRNALGDDITSTVGKGDKKDYYHNRAINQKYNYLIGHAVRDLLKDPNFSLKDCRALYTEITYEDHALDGESRSAYRHRVLGHSLIETQLHYEAFKVSADVETIKRAETGTKKNENAINALIEYLSKHDTAIKEHVRAPKMIRIHEWLKDQISGGLPLETITASYIRKGCIIDGKQLNLNSIKTYLGEDWVNLAAFKPPAPEPKNKHEKAVQKLKEKIELSEQVIENLEDETSDNEEEIYELENKIIELSDRNSEIESELESERETVEILHKELESLENEASKQADDLDSDDLDEDESEWPEPSEIDITCKKVGKRWQCNTEVNGEPFEVIVSGKKSDAINELKNYYKKWIEQTE